MQKSLQGWLPALALLCATMLPGCGFDKSSKLYGRWFSKDVSIRFRDNGTVLYNSRSTGLVEGRYQYTGKQPPVAGSTPLHNLTLWLPQPGRTLALNFEVQLVGDERLKLRAIRESRRESPAERLNRSMGMVLKRATDGATSSDGFDETPPLVSATPEQL